MSSNHLVGQKSPYLLQHLNNPVDWYPWGEEAFQKAKTQQKPVLLSIGYSTCHWCHVMAHESFEDVDIAKIINQHFVAIKVDREERPDLDHIYMSVTTMLTGQGGWPMTVFLTPEAKPFYAGTYFPPYAKWGSPGFVDVLNSVAQGWEQQRENILSSSDQITQLLNEQAQKAVVASQVPDVGLLQRTQQQISMQFDRNNGGFGSAPKFPMGHQISFLLRCHQRYKDQGSLAMAEASLMAMSRGGINDLIGGGFHRYSTDAYWHVPHFEKMLYDQALLIKAYLEAYQVTGNKEYAWIAKNTLDYVVRDMQDAQGGFYSAEDADSLVAGSDHKSEGAFYIWSEDEIKQVLGQETAKIFNYVYGVKPQGNARSDPHGEFINKNILYQAHTIEEASQEFNQDPLSIEQMLEKAKQQLFDLRNTRVRPHLDDKILTDWNGLMIGAFALAGCVLNEASYITVARKAADFILNHLQSSDKLYHRWRESEAGIEGMLDDYAFLINGLLDLYEASFDEKYLNHAKGLAKRMLDLFEDTEKGGFYLTPQDSKKLIANPKDIYDGAIPSGNSVAAAVVMRLHHIDSDPRWIKSFEGIMKIFSSLIEKSPSAYTFILSMLDFYYGPTLNITLEGSINDSRLDQMKRVVYKHYIPNKSIMFHLSKGKSKAYVCQGNVCQQPTESLEILEKQLL